MYTRFIKTAALGVLCACVLAGAGSAVAAEHDAPAMTQTAGDYKITIKVLPAEPFVRKADAGKSSHAGAMVNGTGADPVAKGGDANPNHHLVAFIKKNGEPVEHADVKMSYQQKGASGGMQEVPVSLMWVAGAGRKTTHYGNNVKLEPGEYKVHVTVNDSAEADFDVHVKSES